MVNKLQKCYKTSIIIVDMFESDRSQIYGKSMFKITR